MLLTLILYIVLGAFSGLVAGLFGIGGGAVIVPVLIYAFALQGVSPDVLTHMAVGTSLAVICLTSISSIKAHHNNGFVIWPYVKLMAPALFIGVIVGVCTAVQIPGPTLQWIIGSFLCVVAVQMGFNLMPQSAQEHTPSTVSLVSAGGFIGWISALFGIGGGTLTVPYLSLYGTRMQKTVATSAACGFPIALGGALTNIYSGWSVDALPAGSIGYIYLPAFIGIAAMSMPFAKVGANLAKSLPATTLKRSFAVFLFLVGSSIILKASGVL